MATYLIGVRPRACCMFQRLAGGLTWNELKDFLHALHPTREADVTEGEVRPTTQGRQKGKHTVPAGRHSGVLAGQFRVKIHMCRSRVCPVSLDIGKYSSNLSAQLVAIVPLA